MKENHRILILLVLYVVGLSAMYIPSLKAWCLPLTPLNLILSFLLLMDAFRWNKAIFSAALQVFFIGMSAEWIGVHSGWLFGEYHYVTNLGPKAFGVPLIIGVNWALLTFLSFAVASRVTSHVVLRLILGATIMTAMDFVMEPVAIRHQFWMWETGYVPGFNYVSWFFVSLLTVWVVSKRTQVALNNTALVLFILINLFFIIQFFW
ncbi:MAG: carotenoid biosynthesis protein [Flavobacteriales bacterium]